MDPGGVREDAVEVEEPSTKLEGVHGSAPAHRRRWTRRQCLVIGTFVVADLASPRGTRTSRMPFL
jgi:hypothetical protein